MSQTKTFKDITIKAEQSQTKEAPWQPAGMHYRCTVSRNGKRASFDFWDSVAAYQSGEHADPLDTLHSWMGDALTGWQHESADDIADEFGYKKPSEAIRVFNGVTKARKQAERLGFEEQELADLYTELDR